MSADSLPYRRILVTGASGFVGSHLCRALLEFPVSLRALHRSPVPAWLGARPRAADLSLTRCDIADAASIDGAFVDFRPDIVFHAAAHIPSRVTGEERECFTSNVLGTMNLLEAMRHFGTGRIVFSSTGAVYGAPESYPVAESHPLRAVDFYCLTKIAAETLCEYYSRSYPMQVTILRYAGIYGPERARGVIASWIQRARGNEDLNISSSASTKDVVHVDDVTRSNLLAAARPPQASCEVFNIAGGQELTLRQMAEQILELTSSSSRLREEHTAPLTRISFDIAKASSILGFHPMTFKEGVLSMIRQSYGKETSS